MRDSSKLLGQNKSVYIGEDNKHYGAKYNLSGRQFKCFSKKQLKILYPNKDYKLVAEYTPNNKKKISSSLEYKKKNFMLSKYKSHNRVSYREVGFVDVGDDSFVVLLKNKLALSIAAVVLAAAIITVGAVLGSRLAQPAEIVALEDELIAAGTVENRSQPELEESAVDWEGAKPRDTGGVARGIAIPGYKSITINAGQTDIRVNLQNPKGNPCYFVISLILEDGTVLYKSKMVEPGKGLYNITISQPLEIGEYPAVVKYETFGLEDLNPLNGAEVKISLIAE